METKHCSRCNQILPITAFHKRHDRQSGHASCCRACTTVYRRALRKIRGTPSICQQCQASFLASPGNVKRGNGRFCSWKCFCQYRRAEHDRHFWDYVEKTDTVDGCWLWTGCTDVDGYGVFRSRPPTKAHRFAWTLAHGPIPDGMWVLHSCDVPACTRPGHLFLGTPRDNVRDCIEKGRRKNQHTTEYLDGRKPHSNPVLETVLRDRPVRIKGMTHEQWFWAQVVVADNPLACWLWIGRRNHHGYGLLSLNNRVIRAHRFAYALHYGPFLETLSVRHACNNRSCVNFRHLCLGTQQDNMRDMVQSNRHHWLFAPDEVQAIRALQGRRSAVSVASTYGVTAHTIWRIWRRTTYKHIK